MERLYNSRGEHIANVVGDRLSPSGQNIGRNVGSYFVDISGSYLGEVVQGNRLMGKTGRGLVNHGNAGNSGNVGNYGNPGNVGSVGIGGYEDVDL